MYVKFSLVLVFTISGMLTGNVAVKAQQEIQDKIPASLELENGLYQGAIDLLDQFRELDSSIENVGALKFVVVHEGAKRPPRSLGRLNMRLAEKLETALVWASPKSNKGLKQPFGVVKNATQIAADIGLNHLNKSKARAKFFEVSRPLYWENEKKEVKASADALIYGFAELSSDLSKIKIELSAFSKVQPEVEIQTTPFTATLELTDLLDGGMSFSSRGQSDQPKVVKFHRPQSHPLETGPLKLEIYFGDTVESGKVRWDQVPQRMTQTVDPDSGRTEMMIPEPAVGRRMNLVVSRRDPSNQTRYGVLLRVNGVNSLYSDTLPDERSALWVMTPLKQRFSIQGFQTTIGAEGKRKPFTSVGGREADEFKRFYGSNTGLISMTLFEELSEEKPDHSSDGLTKIELQSIESSIVPKQALANRSSLTARYRAQLFPSEGRGIITPGKEQAGKTAKPVKFRRDPIPVFSGSLRYFRD